MALGSAEAEGITVKVGGVRLGPQGAPLALGPLDLRLTARRIGILGRNGSGKTTLLRLIAGLVAPASGAVTVEGIDPFADRNGALARIGILFQNPDHQILFPTVDEELAFGLRQQGVRKPEAAERVAQALAEAGLSHWAGRATQALSLGQKQHLCLMAVLLMQPGTILLDEPFAALDLPLKARLARRLAALPQRLITISHDPAALEGVGQLIWMETGSVRAEGAPEAVLPGFLGEMARLGELDADAEH